MLNKENLLMGSPFVNGWRKLTVGSYRNLYGFYSSTYNLSVTWCGSLSDRNFNGLTITHLLTGMSDSSYPGTRVQFYDDTSLPERTLYLKRKDKDVISLPYHHDEGKYYTNYDVRDYFTKQDVGKTIDIYLGTTPLREFFGLGGFSHAEQRSSVFVPAEKAKDSFYQKRRNGQPIRTWSSSGKRVRHPWRFLLSDSGDILRRKFTIADSTDKHVKVFFLQNIWNRSINRLLRQMGFCYPLQSFSRPNKCSHQFGHRRWLRLTSFACASFQGGAVC